MTQGDVFKAFCAWRTNAKDFATLSGLDENYPVQVAQTIQKASPAAYDLMALALLMSVPDTAWSVIEKRFGKERMDKLDEAWKHVRTGYTYAEQASDEVKGLAMGAAIVAFDKLIKTAGELGTTLSLQDLGESPVQILHAVRMPECKMYARLEDKLKGTAYPELEKAYTAKLAEYLDARKEMDAQLSEIGIGDDDEKDEAEIHALRFEDHGLFDAPEVRQAYEILNHDTRVTAVPLAAALSIGRLMSDLAGPKNPATIAAGMLDAGLTRRTPDDNQFLAKKLPPAVMDILGKYNISDACMESAAPIADAPEPVRQLAVAKGIVSLDWARKESENLMEFLERRQKLMDSNVAAEMKAESLQPLRMLLKIIPEALAPIHNKTGSKELDQIFDAHLKDMNQFVAAHAPAAAAANGNRTILRMRRPGSGPTI